MRFFYLAAFLLSNNLFANTLYSRLSECTIADNNKTIKIEANYKGPRVATKAELIEGARIALLNEINSKLAKYPNGLVESNVSFSRKVRDPNIKATALLKRVKSCKNQDYIITENNIDLLASFVNKPANSDIQIKLVLDLPDSMFDQVTPLTPELKVSTEQQLGLQLGQSFKQAQKVLGRFSAVLPINESDKIALIGRDHAFSFKDNRYVGYQYHQALLPSTLRNNIELAAEEVQIIAHNRHFNTSQWLSKKELSEIKQELNNLEFVTYGDVKFDNKLLGFTVGEPIMLKQKASLACFDSSQSIQEFVDKNHARLIHLVDNNNRRAMITSCNQKLVLSETKRVQQIEFLEAFSDESSNLLGMEQFMKSFEPWHFENINYGEQLAMLENKQNVTSKLGVVEFNSAKWVGFFNVYDEQILSGKITPLDEE